MSHDARHKPFSDMHGSPVSSSMPSSCWVGFWGFRRFGGFYDFWGFCEFFGFLAFRGFGGFGGFRVLGFWGSYGDFGKRVFGWFKIIFSMINVLG